MSTIHAARIAAAMLVSVGLAGCWDSTDVTVHKAGEYKGQKDPLLAQQASTRSDALMKRFQLVQVDR